MRFLPRGLSLCAYLDWPALAATAVRTLGATAIMGLACYALLVWMGSDGGNFRRLLQVAVPASVGLVVYLGTHRLLGGQEGSMLFTGLVERK